MQSPDLGRVDLSSVVWNSRFDLVGPVASPGTVFNKHCSMGLILVVGSIGGPGLPPRILASARVLRLQASTGDSAEAVDPVAEVTIYNLRVLPAAYAAQFQDVPFSDEYPEGGLRLESALLALLPREHADFVDAYERFKRQGAVAAGTADPTGLETAWLALVDAFGWAIDEGRIVMVARPGQRTARPQRIPAPFDRGWWREGDIIQMDDGQTLFDARFHDMDDVEAWESAPASSATAKREAEHPMIDTARALRQQLGQVKWRLLPRRSQHFEVLKALDLDPAKPARGYSYKRFEALIAGTDL